MAKRSTPPKTSPLKRDTDLPLVSRPIPQPDTRQARLPFDAMPSRIDPCLAKLAAKVSSGDEWDYEIKFDGYRLAIHVELNGIRIITRGGHNWTDRFAGIAAAAREFSPRTVILDGEAVVLDAQGRSSFSALQKALGGRGGKRNAGEAIFYAFDLLYLDGYDLTRLGQRERRQMLADLLEDHEGAIRLSETVDAVGEELLKHACELGLEGIIAKNGDRPYRSGRTGDWLKIKCIQSDSFVVVGYEPSAAVPGAIGSLLLAAKRKGGLLCVGGVGTGFKRNQAIALRRQLDLIRTTKPIVSTKGKHLVWVEPKLVVEVEYHGWTDDLSLRHASFKGLRDIQDSGEIFAIESLPLDR